MALINARTGTVHGEFLDAPLCNNVAGSLATYGLKHTDAAITCKRCLKSSLAPAAEVVEEPAEVAEEPVPAPETIASGARVYHAKRKQHGRAYPLNETHVYVEWDGAAAFAQFSRIKIASLTVVDANAAAPATAAPAADLPEVASDAEIETARRDAFAALDVYVADPSLDNLEALGAAVDLLKVARYGPGESDLIIIDRTPLGDQSDILPEFLPATRYTAADIRVGDVLAISGARVESIAHEGRFIRFNVSDAFGHHPVYAAPHESVLIRS